MKSSNIIVSKSMDFAVRIVNLYKYLTKEKSEYILSKQLLRSGTSIGANVNEAVRAQSTADFVAKMSSENKSNLGSQAKRLAQFCLAKGWVINEIVKECASGLNDNRPKLIKILTEKKATRLVVEHKDRLTRFGFNYIKILYPECEVVVVNEVEDKEDLFEDFVSLVTSFCARIYGRRRSKRKTEELIKKLEEVEENDTC